MYLPHTQGTSSMAQDWVSSLLLFCKFDSADHDGEHEKQQYEWAMVTEMMILRSHFSGAFICIGPSDFFSFRVSV